MKGCILGGVVLTLVLAAVIGNALFVSHTVEMLIEQVYGLPDTPDPTATPAEVASLRKQVEEKEAILGLSVSCTDIDKTVETLRSLESYAASGDEVQYRATVAILLDLVEDIGRLERISLRNIL